MDLYFLELTFVKPGHKTKKWRMSIKGILINLSISVKFLPVANPHFAFHPPDMEFD